MAAEPHDTPLLRAKSILGKAPPAPLDDDAEAAEAAEERPLAEFSGSTSRDWHWVADRLGIANQRRREAHPPSNFALGLLRWAVDNRDKFYPLYYRICERDEAEERARQAEAERYQAKNVLELIDAIRRAAGPYALQDDGSEGTAPEPGLPS